MRLVIAVRIVPNKLGSFEDWILGFASAARAQGHCVTVLTSAPVAERLARALAARGIAWRNWESLVGSMQSAVRWFQTNADVVHLSLFAPRHPLCLAAYVACGSRVVFQDCSSTPLDRTEQYRSLRTRLLDRITFAGGVHVVGVSQFVRDRVAQQFRVRPERLSTVYNGVDTARFTPSGDAEIRDRDVRTRILCVAALIPEKGVDVLLRALPSLSDLDIEVMIAGEGPERANLEQLCAKLAQEHRCTFLGIRNDVQDLLRESEILVHPARWAEAFGLTIAEGMASGCAVVASRVGAIPELIESGVSGLLFARDDSADLSACLRQLIVDRELRLRLGNAARTSTTRMFELSQCIAVHLELVEAILARSERKRSSRI